MAELTNREVIEQFIEAMSASDLDRAEQYLADDLVEDYPQSGERIRGRANRRAVVENYPGRAERDFAPGTVGTLVGDDRWVMTPSMNLVRLNGSGERFTATGQIRYPNGELWHVIQLIELRGGKIAKMTTYFAAPFEAAAYRAKFVERMPAPE
ncbi:MAG TPA: nuclear transport factor 2 family protein [Candidatus Limnocylindria bacterium]|nr:nuclear transport factor 2 family protein [Candidatus Limnocylindria bacterium]